MKKSNVSLTSDEVRVSKMLDRGALAANMYRTLKKQGLMNPDGSPTPESIERLNQALIAFDRKNGGVYADHILGNT
jgi:hypothetical protein